MKIRLLLPLLLAGGLAIGQYRRGVNVSEAEFGQTSIPGTLGKSYTFGSENTFRYFGGKQLGLMRVAVLWERLQPVLGGPLDPAYLQGLKNDIAWAGAHGGEVIVDIHNYGRYSFNESGGFKTYIIDNVYGGVIKVSSADLADLWTRLLKLCEKHEVEFRWVRGHNNHAENERCDTLANDAAKKPGLPVDAGYENQPARMF